LAFQKKLFSLLATDKLQEDLANWQIFVVAIGHNKLCTAFGCKISLGCPKEQQEKIFRISLRVVYRFKQR